MGVLTFVVLLCCRLGTLIARKPPGIPQLPPPGAAVVMIF